MFVDDQVDQTLIIVEDHTESDADKEVTVLDDDCGQSLSHSGDTPSRNVRRRSRSESIKSSKRIRSSPMSDITNSFLKFTSSMLEVSQAESERLNVTLLQMNQPDPCTQQSSPPRSLYTKLN